MTPTLRYIVIADRIAVAAEMKKKMAPRLIALGIDPDGFTYHSNYATHDDVAGVLYVASCGIVQAPADNGPSHEIRRPSDLMLIGDFACQPGRPDASSGGEEE